MIATLNFIFNENDYSNDFNSILTYKDHFSKLYLSGMKNLRLKEAAQENHNIKEALKDLKTLQDHPQMNINSKKLVNSSKSDFYKKNLHWMIRKDRKIEEYREGIIEKEHENIKQGKKILQISNTNYNLPYNYIGPISGWDQRTKEYFDRRNPNNEKINEANGILFKPNLNENSRKMTEYRSNKDEKVEIRLLKQGQEIIKKKEIFKTQIEQIKDLENERHGSKLPLNQTQINLLNERLLNYPKLNKSNNYTQENLTFKPILNKNSLDMAINKKPLYENKFNKNKEDIAIIDSSDIHNNKQKISKSDWEKFLNRNKETENKKKNDIEEKKKEMNEEEKKICSFQPKINAKTIEILTFSNKFESNIILRQNKLKEKSEKTKKNLINKMDEEIKKNCPFKPKISKFNKEKLSQSTNEKENLLENKNKRNYSAKSNKTPEFKKKYKIFSQNNSFNNKSFEIDEKKILDKWEDKNYKNKFKDKKKFLSEFYEIEEEITNLLKTTNK